MQQRAPVIYKGLALTSQYLQTFQQYPPSQRPSSWSIDALTEQLTNTKLEKQ